MNSTFSLSVDKENKVKVESSIAYANWVYLSAYAGYAASFEIGTVFVGNGAPVEVIAKTSDGKKVGSCKGKVVGNKCIGSIDLPEKMKVGDTIFFECKLPKHKVSMESNVIPVNPMLLVTTICWDKNEVARDEILTCKVEFETGCIENNTSALLIIKEYDADNNHDIITKIPVMVMNDTIEVQWQFRFADETKDIPTDDELKPYGKQYQYPEYFFIVDVDGIIVGGDQESGLVRLKDWFELEYLDGARNPIPNVPYTITFADGSTRDGTLDSNGKSIEENIPPGKLTVEYKEET